MESFAASGAKVNAVRIACIALLALCAVPARAGIILAGEPVRFDARMAPQFTVRQLRHTAAATRAGLGRWAATEHGRMLINYFAANDYDVMVLEDDDEQSPGSAPQPGLATLAFGSDHSKVKPYLVILNPSFFGPAKGMIPFPTEAATRAELMSTAWAAEMLHVYFYAQGISLPHHPRRDFQEQWRAIAAELGFPGMRHDDDEVACCSR
jgi:hypothetical protein